MSVFTKIGDNRRLMVALHEQLATNMGVVPFVGAGLCVSCGLPEWSGLLRDLAAVCGSREHIDDLIDWGKFEEAASVLEQSLGPTVFAECLRERLSDSAVRQLAGPILLTPALTRGPVMTTNLDCVLERVFERSGYPFERVGLGPNVDTVRGALHQNYPYLIKLHGGLDDPTTRVLTLEDYVRAYGSRDASNVSSHLALPRLLEQIFTSRTLLFLGCSLKWDRTLTYLKRVQERHGAPALHFALLADPGDKAARQLRAAFLAEVNIRAIWYPRHRHDLIISLLEEVMEPKFMPASGPPTTGIPASRLGEYVAVDLGTSFSAVAYKGGDDSVHHCRLFSQDCGELTRTVVRFLSEYEYTIGDCRADPGGHLCEIRHFKRSLGSDHRYRVGRRDYSASDLAALFLKGVRLALQAQFVGRLPPVLVAIPANFSSRQVDDLARAVRRAGFRLERFVGEPCAAGLNLREFRSTRDLTFMVIDIGGGTTDISIIERTSMNGDFVFEIGCVAGDNMLGGVDFDEVICELVREHCLSILGQYGLRVFELQRPFIEPQARAMKDSFNKRKAGEVTLADVEVTPGRLGTLRVPVSREQFANASGALLARIERLIDYALAGFVAAGFDPSKIEAVMLAGQGSKLTPIRRLLRSKLRLPIIRRYEESAVVRGLAQQAGILGARVHDRLLLDVTYHAIHMPLRPGMRAYRDYDCLDSVERFFRERKRDPDGRIDVVQDVTGRKFLALVERYESVPSQWSTRVEFKRLVEQFEFETFESGDNPDTPFLLRRKWVLQFSEPVGELRIDMELDLNRNVEVTLVLQHAYIVSMGSSENDQRKVGKFYVSMPG